MLLTKKKWKHIFNMQIFGGGYVYKEIKHVIHWKCAIERAEYSRKQGSDASKMETLRDKDSSSPLLEWGNSIAVEDGEEVIDR